MSKTVITDREKPRMGLKRLVVIVVKSLAIVVVVLAASVALSGAYNLVVSAVLQHRYPPPGKTYRVNGYAMHIYCTGSGAPTVVVEAGLGNDFISWQRVQPEVARFTRICTYDRAGLGWSDERPDPHDAKHIAQQLHALLQADVGNSPIILVGASAGGLYARQFVSDFPQLVAGMVFSDSSSPDQTRDVPTGWSAEKYRNVHHESWWDLIEQATGWARIRGQCNGEVSEGLDAWRNFRRAEACRPAYARAGSLPEWEEFWTSAEQARNAKCCNDIPLVVVSQDPDRPNQTWSKARIANWNQAQESLKSLSSQSHRVIARGSGHHVMIERPDVVVAAIQQVVNEVREHKPDPHAGATVVQ